MSDIKQKYSKLGISPEVYELGEIVLSELNERFEKIDKQVTAVLTKSQQKKYEEMKQARQNRRQK